MSGERVRPLDELRSTGLLWLINASVLHPRGFALGIEHNEQGEATGWVLLGDGSEPWSFGPDIDECFGAVEAFLAEHRRGSDG